MADIAWTRRFLGPLLVGAIAGSLVWAVAADVIESGAVFPVLILTVPAFMVALIANASAHNPNNFVWVVGAIVQWAFIASLFRKGGSDQKASHGPGPENGGAQ